MREDNASGAAIMTIIFLILLIFGFAVPNLAYFIRKILFPETEATFNVKEASYPGEVRLCKVIGIHPFERSRRSLPAEIHLDPRPLGYRETILSSISKQFIEYEKENQSFEILLATKGDDRHAEPPIKLQLPMDRSYFWQVMDAFSMRGCVNTMAGTRCKPWDHRELDVLEAFKFISMLFCMFINTAYFLLPAPDQNIWAILDLLKNVFIGIALCS